MAKKGIMIKDNKEGVGEGSGGRGAGSGGEEGKERKGLKGRKRKERKGEERSSKARPFPFLSLHFFFCFVLISFFSFLFSLCT